MAEIARIRLSTLFKAISINLLSPFTSLYALKLGASNFQIGLISSITTLLSVVAQLVSLPILLSFRKKLMVHTIFDAIGALLFIPIAFVKNPNQLILFLTLQAFFFSFPAQVWNEFQVRIFPHRRRGTEVGILNKIGGVGAFFAYLIAGYVIRKFGFIPYLFFAAAFFGITRNIVLMRIKESSLFSRRSFKSVIKEILSFKIFRNLKFRKLLLASFFFNFAVSIGAPMFSVYLIKNLGADSVQLSIVSTISLLVSITFSEAWGRVADFIGRREVIIAGLPLIALFPLFYLISTNMLDVYIFTFIAQIGWVAFNIAMFSYLADIGRDSPQIYFTFFNSISSISAIFGSMMSGYFADIMGIKSALIASFCLRVISIFFFLSLGEKKGYRPRGILPFLSPHAFVSSVEFFISIYSIVFEETRKSMLERILRRIKSLLK